MRNETETTFRTKLAEQFGVDVRSLAIFRMGLGTLLLADLIVRARDLKAHYSNFGVLPLEVFNEKIMRGWYFSIHALNGSVAFQGVLFSIAAIAAAALILGYRTRIAIVISWFLLISLQTRNLWINQLGDKLLCLLLFWGCFIPLGACWSLDQERHAKASPLPQRIFSAGTMVLLFQVALVYWATAWLKWKGMAWRDGTAVYYALSIDQYVKPFGLYLLKFPSLMKGITYFTLGLESLGPFFFFAPVRVSSIRTAVVFLFVLFHIGLGLSLTLGLFPWISSVSLLVFLPSRFWNELSRRYHFKISLDGSRYRGATIMMNILVFIITAYIFASSFFPVGSRGSGLRSFQRVSRFFRLHQRWVMFTPVPRTNDAWHVFPGRLEDGTVVDLFRKGAPVRWKKPELVSAMYESERWQNYITDLPDERFKVQRGLYAEYLCREWNHTNDQRRKLQSLKIVFVREDTPPPGQTPTVRKDVLLDYRCP